MDKHSFLSWLRDKVQRIPEEAQQAILQDFEARFDLGLKEGKTEKEVVDSFGPLQQLEEDVLADYYASQPTLTAAEDDSSDRIWAIIGLTCFNVIIVLGPLMGLVGLFVAGWTVGGAFILSPVLCIVEVMMDSRSYASFDLFVSIALSGLGLFILVGMLKATRFFTKVIIAYINYNIRVIRGGKK
ncbi:DUF1700 domain-containing protein [Gracilibacillus sp. S3-1-1]|uniref:DUF1700 domain-containing protein n=1 Tax=Gracilibacillus pellucidus TaxID=3095368 RepID=A0ACC6M5X9_9BACI|nr:DUF1700 domain-containing protein [Gracilibacillus sp. S3-1-1]MDX8046393.1 DUF1700 domain-containing protein [Gracilibacillus sp. S3-1-1]